MKEHSFPKIPNHPSPLHCRYSDFWDNFKEFCFYAPQMKVKLNKQLINSKYCEFSTYNKQQCMKSEYYEILKSEISCKNFKHSIVHTMIVTYPPTLWFIVITVVTERVKCPWIMMKIPKKKRFYLTFLTCFRDSDPAPIDSPLSQKPERTT